jgi:hypothetical protein
MANLGSALILRHRHGSCTSRCSHSRPSLCTQVGALFLCPEMKSKAPPTPIATGTAARDRLRAIHFS